MDDVSLGKFIAAVERVRREGAGELDRSMRDEVVRELGWSAEELEAARQHGEADLLRGEGFLRHRAWDDARRSLRDAEALLPDDLRVLYALARASEGLRDHVGARRYTERCLALDPRHEPSFELRARLQARPTRRRRLALIAAVVAGATGAMVAARSTIAPPSRAETLCNGPAYCERPVAVTAAPPLRVDHPILRVSPRDLRLELAAVLVHPAAETSEIEELVVELRLFDDHDTLLGTREVVAQPDFAPPLRPGDTAPFFFGEQVPAATRRAELVVLRRRAVPSPVEYGTATPVRLSFEPPAPAHFQLQGGFRSYQRQQLGEMTSFEAVLEVENRGTGTIRALELEWRAHDAAGAMLGRADKQTMAYGHMPPMRPGERRAVRMRLWVPRRVASEAVVVTQVQ